MTLHIVNGGLSVEVVSCAVHIHTEAPFIYTVLVVQLFTKTMLYQVSILTSILLPYGIGVGDQSFHGKTHATNFI